MKPAVRHAPNLLSFSRILLGVAFFFLYRLMLPWSSLAAMAIVAMAGATDVLDGILARRNNRVSLIGKWLDPLSDFSFFFFVYFSFFRSGLMPTALFALFLARESLMYALIRPLSLARRLDPAAKLPGKIKTISQNIGSLMVLLLLFLSHLEILPAAYLPVACAVILLIPICLSLASLYWYITPLLASGKPVADVQVPRIILLSVLVLFVLQYLLIGALTWIYGLPLARMYLFLAISALWHALFTFGLLMVKKEFNLETTGETLRRMNLPLILSFLRFSSVPALLFLFLSLEKISVTLVLIPFLAMIFLTDLLDGILARRFNQTTRIGRILDASGDYVLTAMISIVYLILRWIPLWFLILVFVRLAVQCAGIVTLYALQGYSALRLSFLGKASIFAIFTLYGIELLEYLKAPVVGSPALVTALEYGAAAILVASLAEKLFFLQRDFRPLLARRRARG